MPTMSPNRRRKRSGALDVFNHAKHGCRKKASDPSIPPRHGCPFLGLPRELRDRIYEYALVVGVVRVDPVIQPKCFKPFQRYGGCQNAEEDDGTYDFCIHEYATSRHVAMGLLQTCRQVFEESACVLYSKNTFFFSSDDHDPYSVLKVNVFFASLPRKAMSWIKSVKIEMAAKNLSWNSHWKLRQQNRWRANMVQFRRTFAECLPALEHVSIVVGGWTSDLCIFASTERHFQISEDDYPNFMSILPLLPKFKRLSIEILALRVLSYLRATEVPCSLVGLIALIRSHVLQNGDRLGTENVMVHNRHYAQYVYPPGQPENTVFRRLMDQRVCVAQCDDDATGKSFLKSAQRLSPLWVNKDHWKDLLGPQFDPRQLHRGHKLAKLESYMHLEDPGMDAPDYAQSDDGDNDSLNELDLSDQNVEPVALPDKVITLMEETLDGNIGGWN
ncbi:hypothetical protein HDK77DRAFT_485438 [Phyllosticta capitalensis]